MGLVAWFYTEREKSLLYSGDHAKWLNEDNYVTKLTTQLQLQSSNAALGFDRVDLLRQQLLGAATVLDRNGLVSSACFSAAVHLALLSSNSCTLESVCAENRGLTMLKTYRV